MMPSDFYFLVDKELKAVFLVSREFWRKSHHVPYEHRQEWERVMPEGFVKEGDNLYRYYFKKKICFKKGVDVLLGAGFVEIHWGELG